jgi:CheY-like chemotaxis protein
LAEHKFSVERLRSWRVLVADDEPAVLASIRRHLERLGITVEVARDGSEAEAQLRGGGFDLALLDVTMPRGGGYDVLPFAPPTTRVVLMSGYSEAPHDGVAFLEKPFSQRVLEQLLKQLAST